MSTVTNYFLPSFFLIIFFRGDNRKQEIEKYVNLFTSIYMYDDETIFTFINDS